MVTKQAWLAVSLVLHRGRRKLEFGEVSDDLVGEHHPELVGDELGHFFAEEGGVLVRRLVAASFDVEVAGFDGPAR